MKICPQCQSPLKTIGQDFFCLDCDFDTLKPSSFQGTAKTEVPLQIHRPTRRSTRNTTPQWIDIDAEWYFKTQLKKYRKWKDRDFEVVPANYIHRRYGGTTIYFHRSTVEVHEATSLFRDHPRRQTLVPEEERINELAYNLTVRGDVLIENGWTYEMIDKLEPFVPHPWRRKRKFLLIDLEKVSKTFCVGKPVHKLPSLGGPSPNPYRFL